MLNDILMKIGLVTKGYHEDTCMRWFDSYTRLREEKMLMEIQARKAHADVIRDFAVEMGMEATAYNCHNDTENAQFYIDCAEEAYRFACDLEESQWVLAAGEEE